MISSINGVSANYSNYKSVAFNGSRQNVTQKIKTQHKPGFKEIYENVGMVAGWVLLIGLFAVGFVSSCVDNKNKKKQEMINTSTIQNNQTVNVAEFDKIS